MKKNKVENLRIMKKIASAGVGAITQKWRCVHKCVRNNF